MIVSAIWAAALGQTLVACIFGLFSGFRWSYAELVLGGGRDAAPMRRRAWGAGYFEP